MAIERDFTELGQFDLATLLRISDKSWYGDVQRCTPSDKGEGVYP